MTTTTQGSRSVVTLTGRAGRPSRWSPEANQKILRDWWTSPPAPPRGRPALRRAPSPRLWRRSGGSGLSPDRQSEIQERPRDPFASIRRACCSPWGRAEGLQDHRSNAQAMTRSAERLQVTAEQTGKEIQATFAQSRRMKSLYSPLGLSGAAARWAEESGHPPGLSLFSARTTLSALLEPVFERFSCSRSETLLRRASASWAVGFLFPPWSRGRRGIHPERTANREGRDRPRADSS